MINIIAAVAENGVIGREGKLPWRIPEDLKRFKEFTTGKTVLMGRKTFESILGYLGHPLPNRKNIVITRQENYPAPDGVLVYSNVEQAFQAHAGENIFIIGGAEIYTQTILHADKLYITEINKEAEGDAYFPEIDKSIWKEILREPHDGFSFVTYEK